MPTTLVGLQEPNQPRIVEGAVGTLCAQCRPIRPLGTGWPRALVPLESAISVFSRVFRVFRLFRQIQAALAYPLSSSGHNGQNCSEPLVYGFWSLQGPLVPLDPDHQRWSGSPTPGRLNRTVPAKPELLGLHTARFRETAGSGFFREYWKFS